ncbi:MAG: TetR/AcrR family transcriptional regulator [Bdellovibrionales bacterium]|nr:TetR/AcrR family transcriptional regulator [Bdellovibrionales bacterium]
MKKKNTKIRILKEGKSLLQSHGYHGFSFQNIADKIKIKKPSLYDHYASKSDLVIAILVEYETQFEQWAAEIHTRSPLDQIESFFEIFHGLSLNQGQLCPILTLTTDFSSLPQKIQKQMTRFIDKWIFWLETRVLEGQKQALIAPKFSSSQWAFLIYSQAMGAQIQSRLKKNPNLILDSCNVILNLLKQK